MPDKHKMIAVDPANPDPQAIDRAGKILADNGIVIFPAQCLYGVAAHALAPRAVEKVFALKQRPAGNPLLVLVKDRTMIASLVTRIPPGAGKLMDTFWPGKLTLVMHAASHIPESLTAGTGKIGIRVPFHPTARALVRAVDFPITGTSANLSGRPGCTRTADLAPSILKKADLILDAGSVAGGTGSTIVDVTGTAPVVLREGKITADQIEKAFA